jgi:hypothetical protein
MGCLRSPSRHKSLACRSSICSIQPLLSNINHQLRHLSMALRIPSRHSSRRRRTLSSIPNQPLSCNRSRRDLIRSGKVCSCRRPPECRWGRPVALVFLDSFHRPHHQLSSNQELLGSQTSALSSRFSRQVLTPPNPTHRLQPLRSIDQPPLLLALRTHQLSSPLFLMLLVAATLSVSHDNLARRLSQRHPQYKSC